jgi:hypothetical protein
LVRITRILLVAACLSLVGGSRAHAQVLAPPFNDSYSLHDLGAPPGVPAPLGGLTLKEETTDRLLIGGAANVEDGALYEVGLQRDEEGHITGFSDEATRFADAAYNDGGVTYGPDGVLFLARWPQNELGQIAPSGGTKIISLTPFDVASSLASLLFVPTGQPGAGGLKMASYPGGEWYSADVVADAAGTFDLVDVNQVPTSTLPGGPEGFVYVGTGSPGFARPSLLVAEWGAGQVTAYEVDATGDPIVSTSRSFITGLEGAEGAFIDPLTGDFLFSTFGGGDHVIAVRGFAPPVSLAVYTTVRNDNGGVLAPGDVNVHVQHDGVDVVGSPQQGSENGAFFAVEPGSTYKVSADVAPGYVTTIGGDCADDGTVVPQEGAQPICKITADDQPTTVPSSTTSRQDQQQEQDEELPPPEAGKEVNALPKSGTVRVKVAGTNRFVELQEGQQIPVGSVIDTTKGRVTIVATGNQSADFYNGVFRLTQGKGARPLTTLTLVGKLSCPKAGRAVAAAKKKRRLWGDGSGRFRTRGKHSAATVVGTRWLVEDRCTSTLTRVARGRVSVRDFVKKKTVTVRAGKTYVARAKR